MFVSIIALALSALSITASAEDAAPTTVTLTLAGVGQGIVGVIQPANSDATALQNVAVPTAQTWHFSPQQAGAQFGLKVEHGSFFAVVDSSAMFGGLGQTTNGMPVLQTLNSTLGGTVRSWTLSLQGGLFANQRGFEPVLPGSVSQQWFVMHATPTYEWSYWNFGAEFVAAHSSGNAFVLGYSSTWDGVVRLKPPEQQPTVYGGVRIARDWGSVAAHVTAAPTLGHYDADTAGEVYVSTTTTLRWQGNAGYNPGQSATECGFLAARVGGPVRGFKKFSGALRVDGCGEQLVGANSVPTLLDAAGDSTNLYRVAGTANLTAEPWEGVQFGVEGTGGVVTGNQPFWGVSGVVTVSGAFQTTLPH